MGESPTSADIFAATASGCALRNSNGHPQDPSDDHILLLESDETDSDSSGEIYVGTDGCRHIDTADDADGTYTINSAVLTKVVVLPESQGEAVTEMRSYLHRSLPHISRSFGGDVSRAREIQTFRPTKRDTHPTFLSDDLIANIIRSIARELAGHCVFIVRPRSDQPAHLCDHPFCFRARAQPETMWLSIEPFMDWEILEPAEYEVAGGAILVFKRNAGAGAGGFRLNNFMPSIQMKFCIHCLGDLWNRRHIVGLSPFTSPKRVKNLLPSSRLSNIDGKVADNAHISPAQKAAIEKLHHSTNFKMTDNSYGRVQTLFTSLDSKDYIGVLTGSPDKRIMDLDGVSSGNQDDVVSESLHGDDAGNEADIGDFSNDASRTPIPKSWGNPVNSTSGSPSHCPYVSPYPLQLNTVVDIVEDEFPPLPNCKARVSLRGLGVTRTKIRDAARRAGIMVSDAQREFLEKNGVAIPPRIGSIISLQSPYGSSAPEQPPTPSSVRRTPSLRSCSSNLVSSKTPTRSPQKRATNMNFERVDEEEKRCQNSITARILRDQETTKIERGLEREAMKKRSEYNKEMRRKRRADSQSDNEIKLEKLYNIQDSEKQYHMVNYGSNTQPFQTNPSTESPSGSQTHNGKGVLSFSQQFPPLWCYCHTPDNGNTTIQCEDIDCPVRRYHSSCMIGRENATCRASEPSNFLPNVEVINQLSQTVAAENWTCNICKHRRAMEKVRELTTMESLTAAYFTPAFSMQDIATSLAYPGPFYGGVRNPYGLASAAEPFSPDIGPEVPQNDRNMSRRLN